MTGRRRKESSFTQDGRRRYLLPPSINRRPRIIAVSFSRRKKLVATAFDQGNTVLTKGNSSMRFIGTLTLLPCLGIWLDLLSPGCWCCLWSTKLKAARKNCTSYSSPSSGPKWCACTIHCIMSKWLLVIVSSLYSSKKFTSIL